MLCIEIAHPVQQLITDIPVFSGFSPTLRPIFDTDNKQSNNAKAAGHEKNFTLSLDTPFLNLNKYYKPEFEAMKT